MDDIETLDKIRDMLLEGYRKASENFKARESEQKNTAGEAESVIFSSKDNEYQSIKNQIQNASGFLLEMEPVDNITFSNIPQNKKDFMDWLTNQLKPYGEKFREKDMEKY